MKFTVDSYYNQTIAAFAEENNGCVYMYVLENNSNVFGKCWVCNTKKAPENFDMKGMGRGKPPRMIRAYCDHPKGMKAPDSSAAKIVWYDNGNTAALIHNDKIIAVISNISSRKCISYALHAIAEAPNANIFSSMPENLKTLLSI